MLILHKKQWLGYSIKFKVFQTFKHSLKDPHPLPPQYHHLIEHHYGVFQLLLWNVNLKNIDSLGVKKKRRKNKF